MMTGADRIRNGRTLATLFLATLVLAACMIVPGKFTSDLVLRKDGTFSFTYKGDIHLMALSKMAAEERERKNASATFEPSPCYNEENGEERPCSGNEIADQKATWEEDLAASKAAAAEKKKSDDQMMKAMLGGIDPGDPRAAQEFADRLRRQNGWKSVVDKGEGRFEVEYAVSGKLDHDFVFPTIEKTPMVTPFVTLIRRADGTVRIEAPAFTSGANGSPLTGMAMAAAQEKSGKDSGMPVIDGVLTLVTDGDILANNTDEGPQAVPTGRKLEWKVNGRTASAPTALVRIVP